jgi:hypothetical protein
MRHVIGDLRSIGLRHRRAWTPIFFPKPCIANAPFRFNTGYAF